jgi:hypothetical protein
MRLLSNQLQEVAGAVEGSGACGGWSVGRRPLRRRRGLPSSRTHRARRKPRARPRRGRARPGPRAPDPRGRPAAATARCRYSGVRSQMARMDPPHCRARLLPFGAGAVPRLLLVGLAGECAPVPTRGARLT